MGGLAHGRGGGRRPCSRAGRTSAARARPRRAPVRSHRGRSPMGSQGLNIVLLVIDSLRACSLGRVRRGGPQTPFLDRLGDEAIAFRRASATECWTLPTHMSMFTGLLPLGASGALPDDGVHGVGPHPSTPRLSNRRYSPRERVEAVGRVSVCPTGRWSPPLVRSA